MEKEIGITVKKEEDFSGWYTQILEKAELIEYTDVSGCYVFRPRAYSIWENIQRYFDDKIKKDGVKNAYFPLLIPKANLAKEQKHVEGFTPEVAWVTKAGETELAEELAIRPTSETIFYPAFAKWIRSWRDLPLRINQWANMLRWEFKNPVPFIRSREFLWQEGHSAFANKEEADKETRKMLDFYEDVYREMYAIPVIKGIKTEKEKFAGADYTLTIEIFLPSGKCAQAATSHSLGQNFSKVFDIKFIDKDEKIKYAWQNSWGLSTRSIGILVMMHSDDKGLVLPPKVAENKLVIVPILFETGKKEILKKANELKKQLTEFNPILDDREGYTPGWKFNEWELKGIPIRIEIGPKDIKNKQIVAVRRDSGKKEVIRVNKDINKKIQKILEDIQKNLFNKAKKFFDDNKVVVKTFDELIKAIENKKLVETYWCSDTECEDLIKDKTNGAKIICIQLKQPKAIGKCVYCKKQGKHVVYIAKSY